MASILEGAVFDFCEETYKELRERDGGYYPRKHDPETFEKAANKFNISVEEVGRIYDSYTKVSAEIEARKIARLPKGIREKERMRRLRNLILDNKDLPFHKIEGEPDEALPNAQDTIHDEYLTLVENVASKGWTIPMSIDIKGFQELQACGADDKKIDAFFETFYKKSTLNTTCRKIEKALPNQGQKQRFSECLEAFNQGLYSICLDTLITVLEGFLSCYNDDPNDVRMMKVCKYHADEEAARGKTIKRLCWESMYEYIKMLFEKSHFDQIEPNKVNRHWVLHGRTSRIGEKNDCLRLINALSTLALIAMNDIDSIQ